MTNHYETAADIVMTKDVSAHDIEKAIIAAVEEEREACAMEAEDYHQKVNPECYEAAYLNVASVAIRDRIRARSEK